MHFFHAFSTFNPGGAEMRTVRLMNHFGARARHTIFAMDGNYAAHNLIEPTIAVDILQAKVRKGRGVPNLLNFRNQLQALNPDVLLTYNFGAFEWLFSNLALGIKHIHVEDGFGADEANRRFFRRSLTRAVGLNLSKARLVTVSHQLLQIAEKEWFAPRRRTLFLPNGVELTRFAVAGGFSKESSPSFTVGTVAGLRAEKRVDRIIDAFAIFSNRSGVTGVELLIGGDGPLLGKLRQQVVDLGISKKVQFLGHVAQPEHLYPRLNVFSLGSDTEQMPLVLLEAMAAGLPVASTDVGDVRRMLSESNAEWIAGCDSQKLSEQFFRLYSSVDHGRSIGLLNLEKVSKKYSFEGMVRSWEKELFESHQS